MLRLWEGNPGIRWLYALLSTVSGAPFTLQILNDEGLTTHFIAPCIVTRAHCQHKSCNKCPLHVDTTDADKVKVINAAKEAATSVAKNVKVDVDTLVKGLSPSKAPTQLNQAQRHAQQQLVVQQFRQRREQAHRRVVEQARRRQQEAAQRIQLRSQQQMQLRRK